MIKKIFIGLGLILFCGVIGGGYAIFSLKSKVENKAFSLQNGCWTVNQKMDLKDRHQRAIVSIAGLFALRETEVLYFVASKDSDGQPLSSDYTYRMEGHAPAARYWSYTMYGNDFFLIENDQNIYGYNMDNIQYIDESDNPEMASNALGNHQVILSNKSQEGNWLPTGTEDQFYITLRMYNPGPEVYNNLANVVLPTIKRIDL